MKQKSPTLKQTCIRTVLAITVMLLFGYIWCQPSFTTKQTFRRMEAYHGVAHSQIVYTNRGSIDTIFSTAQLDYTVYSKEDVYLGQYGDLYYFAAIEKAPISTNNGASNTFITFQPQEGEMLATTWDRKNIVPEHEWYPSWSHFDRYIAGVVTDPAAAKVVAEIWLDETVQTWTSLTTESLNTSYGSGPPWKKTVETTEFYNGMFLIYTGFEFWWGTSEEILDYGYTITVYDADGNMIAQHDQPMSHTQAQDAISPASGMRDQTVFVDGDTAVVAIENTNDYDVELCADYELYYANHNNIPAEPRRLDTEEDWVVIPAGQTRQFTFDYVENKPINLFSDKDYYNTLRCVIRPVGETHGGEYWISVFAEAA